MWRGLSGLLTGAIRNGVDRGLSALVWGLSVGAFIGLGMALLGMSLLLALAHLIGPVLACFLLGLGLLVAAALMIALRRPAAGQAPAPPRPPEPPAPSEPALDEVAFALGFVAARALLRRLGRSAGP